MDVKEASRLAKQHVAELLKEEGAKDIGLEEIEFDEAKKAWRVTVGFTRPWNAQNDPLTSALYTLDRSRKSSREMKVVTLDDDNGRILALKNRG